MIGKDVALSDAPDTNAAILAHHYFEAGELAKTFHYALMAGDAAARLYAHPEALMHYDRALQMVHRLSGTPDDSALTDGEIQVCIRIAGACLN